MIALEFSLFQSFMPLHVPLEAYFIRNKLAAYLADQIALLSGIFSLHKRCLVFAWLRSKYFMRGHMLV